MHGYQEVMLASPLFAGVDASELEAMLRCLSMAQRGYAGGEAIYRAGDTAFQIGLVLSGEVDIVQEDFWGNQGILARLSPGGIFAESFVLAGAAALPVTVVATRDTFVLLLDYARVQGAAAQACPYHARVDKNLLAILAGKNIALTQKVEQVTRRTTREKLLAFLSAQAKRAGSASFTIPYDRQALADYLAVDRSAMSAELGRMRRDGLLIADRSRFTLLATDQT